MNGVIGAGGYNRIIAGTASTVLGLVAVEGLTGGRFADSTTISPEAPAVSSNATSGVVENLGEAAGEAASTAPGVAADRPGRADARPVSSKLTTAATVGAGATAENPGSGDAPAPKDVAQAPAVTEHAADAVVKVVCLASAGTSRDRSTRQRLFELCLGRRFPPETETGPVTNDAGAAGVRQHVKRAGLEQARR